MSFSIPESVICSTTSLTFATRCSTPESIPSDVEVCADDPTTTCFLPEINPLLFKMMVDSDSDKADNLYMFSPLTPINLDTPVPFPAARLMAHAINDPVGKPDTTSPKFLEPQEVWKAYAFKDISQASLKMIQAPANSIKLVTASSDFLLTLRRLRCEYYSKGLASSSSSQTGSTSTSGWDSNKPHFKCIPSDPPTNLEDYKPSMPSTDIWPSPPSTLVEGNDMHPPQELIAGVHPGEGWHYNSIKHWNYYRFLIPDPTVPGCLVVTPFINFHMHPSKPQVSAAYGLGLPIWMCELHATPVDYPTPSLSPNQICLLDPAEPFAHAFDKVVQDHLPYNLIAALQQYRHFKVLQYKAQGKASELCIKGTNYLECAMEVLSDLENANIIGRVYPQYEDEIVKKIGDNVATGHAFYKALNTWENPIAWHHNQMHNLEV
jgi:hypothetical protein